MNITSGPQQTKVEKYGDSIKEKFVKLLEK